MNKTQQDNPDLYDANVIQTQPLPAPTELIAEFPVSNELSNFITTGRNELHNILSGEDDRFIIIAGPCSIHDEKAAMDYGRRLLELRNSHSKELIVVMRVYFEKPRTTVGWKGLINDPKLDGSYDIGNGLRIARKLLLDLNELGVPAGTEYLDLMTPQYIADLISWGAIGARTTESQLHREMASGLSCPVGFKNGTDGNLRIAADAIAAANHPHHFLTLTKNGHSAIFSTSGNNDCHMILRGGVMTNYDEGNVREAAGALDNAGVLPAIMIDFSHANSQKIPEKQIEVCADVCRQIASGNRHIIGVMVESHLVSGRQEFKIGQKLKYGQSITDGCIGWDDSTDLLESLARSVSNRRNRLS